MRRFRHASRWDGEATRTSFSFLRSASLLRDEAGKPAYLIVQFQDITARREAEEQLRYNATHDELTGLLNRSAFEQKLVEALVESRDTGIRHALAFVDLDRLKMINDSAGHVAGDALLRGVAGALPATCVKAM